nr:zinc finger BED domain-containing protein RICESLEEPER 2-like [Ipomoea batatas]
MPLPTSFENLQEENLQSLTDGKLGVSSQVSASTLADDEASAPGNDEVAARSPPRPLQTTKLLLGLRLSLYQRRSYFSMSTGTDLQNPHSLNSVVVESNDILNDIQEQAEGLERMVDQQTKLNFMPSDGVSSSIPLLHLGKFDMELMRESAANWIMMLKHPFTILEEVGFNLMMKRGWPE